jgi:hypothetical protein
MTVFTDEDADRRMRRAVLILDDQSRTPPHGDALLSRTRR